MVRQQYGWLRWLQLICALGTCWFIWREMELYNTLREGAVFSKEILMEIGADLWFSCALRGLMALTFFYGFVTWKRDKTASAALLDGIFCSILFLLWAGLPLFMFWEGEKRWTWLFCCW